MFIYAKSNIKLKGALMKKRVFILGFLVSVLALPTVIAANSGPFGSILPIFKDLGTFLFRDLPTLGDYGFKFLLWIALFALMNFGLKAAKLDDKTAGITAFVLSLLSVLLIPGKTIEGLFRTYSLIIVFGLGVFIPILLAWVIHKIIPADTGLGKVLRGVAYLIIAYALFTFTNYVALTSMGALR